jgi:hypothetical protein
MSGRWSVVRPPRGRGCIGCRCTRCHRWVIDPPPPPPTVALCLQAKGIGESFKAKSPDPAALEGCLKGAARRRARLAAKCRGETFELPGPRRHLPSKVVSRRRMPCPRSCSLRFLRCGASSDLRFIAVASPGRSGVSRGFLRSAWCKDVEAASGHVECRE